MNVSCSHSLAELSSAAEVGATTAGMMMGGCGGANARRQPPEIHVQSVGSKKIVLECRMGAYFKTRLVPSGQTSMVLMVAEGHQSLDCFQLDDDLDEDWDACKKNASSLSNNNGDQQQHRAAKIDNVRKATRLCAEAANLDPSSSRYAALVNRAYNLAKDACPLVHYMKAVVHMRKAQSMRATSNTVCPRKKMRAHQEEAIRHLKDAVAAGKAFAEMINATEFCPGNLYQFVPTR